MWNRKNFLLAVLFVVFVLSSAGRVLARQITQTVRGTVVDRTTRIPLEGASVVLLHAHNVIGTSTNEEGVFELNNVPVGRQALMVSYTGYKSETVSQLLVNSGKETVLQITMEQAPYQLAEVQVTADNEAGAFERLGKIDISSEQFQRIAANYLDPARVVMSSPSIANTNDQNNAISVRGNSPLSNTWRLEGVEIVNPNHLANAGTISDRPTQNGGGVNVLSTQMLDNSTFLMGYMPAGYGNAVGGIFDMNFRHGNNQQREYTAQASVIGLDFAAEGPFRQGGSASYLVNYRYSFTGLMAAMGVDFGGETIKFQDLSFNIAAPETPVGKVTLFGINGWNSNVYARPEEKVTIEKELSNIDYGSSIYAYGLTQEANIGRNTSWRNVVVYSATDTDREQEELIQGYDNSFFYYNDYEKASKVSFSSVANRRWGDKVSTEAGLRGTFYAWNIQNIDSVSSANADFDNYPNQNRKFDLNGLLLQPFLSASWQATSKLGIDLGLNSSWFDYTNEFLLEPRLNMALEISGATSLSARTGLYSQVLSPYAYNTHNSPPDSGFPVPSQLINNTELSFLKSWTSEIGINQRIGQSLNVTSEVFYQLLSDVPTYTDYSYLNYDGEDSLSVLASGGEGRTYGISAEARQQIINGFYVWTGGTLYRSEYKDQTDDYLPSRFDGRYNFNLTLGKEFQKKKSDKVERLLGFHSRVFYQGGFRQQPLNTLQSEYNVKLDDYFRLDLRVQWTRFKPGYTQLFAIDIQNALFTENPAYIYYDSVAGKVLTKNQLGIIPVILYRIDF